MNKQIAITTIAFILCASSMPSLHVDARGDVESQQTGQDISRSVWTDNYWDTDNDWDSDWDEEDDDWYYVEDDDWYDDDWDNDNDYWGDDNWDKDELTVYDLAVNPKTKRIRKEKSFHIEIIPSNDSEWNGISEEEWNELCEDNIKSIEFSSTERKIAIVNKFTGRVKAKRKGQAVIKTKINLMNEESITFKTKVTVKK